MISRAELSSGDPRILRQRQGEAKEREAESFIVSTHAEPRAVLYRFQVMLPKDMGIVIDLRRREEGVIYFVSLDLAMFKVLTLLIAARL